MVDFRKLISAKSRQRFAAREAILARFEEAVPAGKAAQLLEASRTLIDSGRFKTDQRYSYDEWALYRVIPALARGLAGPGLELRETEIAKPEEKADPITWLGDKSHDHLERLETATRSILANSALRRAGSENDDPVAEAAQFLIGRPHHCAISVALDCLRPGTFPKRVADEAEEKPDLTGFQLIESRPSGHDKVLHYAEDEADLEGMLRVATAIRSGEEISEDDKPIEHALTRWFSTIQTCDALSIQKWTGEMRRETRFDVAPAPGPEM